MSWRLAWRNLQRNKRRSISTGLAVCVGYVALNLLGGYIFRTYETLRILSVYMDQRGHIQIRKKGSVENFEVKPKDYLISKKQAEEIRHLLVEPNESRIEYTGATLTSSGLLSNGTKSHPIITIGFDNESYVRSIQHPLMQDHGRFFLLPWQVNQIESYRHNTELIAITPMIAEIMGFKMPLESNESVQIASLTIDGDLNAVNADLGALHSTGAEFLEASVVMVPLVKIQELLSTDGVESFTIYLKKFSDLESMKKVIVGLQAKLSFPIEVFEYDDPTINSYFDGTMGFLYVMGGFFLILICTAVSLTIINSLTMGIIERTREIGTLMAIGFKPREVKEIFVKESILICLIAMTMGTVLSFFIASLVNKANFMFHPPGTPNEIQFTILWNLQIASIVAGVLLLIAWISSYLVIKRKLKKKLINLLLDIGE